MTSINEKWIPSPNYSSGRSKTLTHGILHTTEGATTLEALGNFFAQSSAGVSSHHGADNVKKGMFGAYVYESNTAWTQGNANGFCVSIELCTPSGASANWSRDYWLKNQDTLLWNAAEWCRYIADQYGLPLIALSNADAQNANVKGFAQHKNLGSMGSGHADCGNIPMDIILQRAIAWSGSSSSGGSEMSVAGVALYNGDAYHACIGDNAHVYIKSPSTGWVSVDPDSNAKNGCDLTIDNRGLAIISYINQAGNVCTYQKYLDDPNDTWRWTNRGGDTLLDPDTSFTVKSGVDYSYDRPDLNCLKGKGVTFVMRYGSRTTSKNLTASELAAIRAAGLKIGCFWQEGKTQMLRGASGGTADAKEADAFFKALGLTGMPIVFACDFDPVSDDWASIDAYMNAVKGYLGLDRTGGYGGKAFITRQFDAYRMKYGVQTYAWSSSGGETQWDARAQLRQIKNDQVVCGGAIDWEEQRLADAPLRA